MKKDIKNKLNNSLDKIKKNINSLNEKFNKSYQKFRVN